MHSTTKPKEIYGYSILHDSLFMTTCYIESNYIQGSKKDYDTSQRKAFQWRDLQVPTDMRTCVLLLQVVGLKMKLLHAMGGVVLSII